VGPEEEAGSRASPVKRAKPAEAGAAGPGEAEPVEAARPTAPGTGQAGWAESPAGSWHVRASAKSPRSRVGRRAWYPHENSVKGERAPAAHGLRLVPGSPPSRGAWSAGVPRRPVYGVRAGKPWAPVGLRGSRRPRPRSHRRIPAAPSLQHRRSRPARAAHRRRQKQPLCRPMSVS
jgi:hypothetical protein